MSKSRDKKTKIHIATVQKKEPEDLLDLHLSKPSPTLLDLIPRDILDDAKKEETLAIRKSTYETKMFMTDGNGRVLSESEQKKVLEDAKQEVQQKEYDEIFGRKPSTEKNSKSIIPEATEIPKLKPTRFEDWQITMDCFKREFILFHWGLKVKLTPTFDDLGFKIGNKPENVKITTLLSYAYAQQQDEKGAGFILHHKDMEKKIKNISINRTYLQRVFREYLNIEPDSKMFKRIPTLYLHKETIIYKCNAKLQQPYDPTGDNEIWNY